MQMRFIFLPKHQRLVNQCYPGGSTTDKKPNSSETSYLLYYVNSRRSKLEKVSSYLVKKTTSDMNRRRVGNIAVTLELMNKIVNNCKENLNVFIKDFFAIMLTVLNNENFNNDYFIIELLELTFSSICIAVDDTLCNGDAEFIRNYSKFIDIFYKIVTTRIHKDELFLRCCEDISKTQSIASNPQLNHYIRKAVDFTLIKFQEKYPHFKSVSLDTPTDIVNLNRRLSRVQTRPNGFIIDSPRPDDICVKILQSFFNTTETDKLNISVRALLTHLQLTPNKELLTYICNKIPVQLRYIVILLAVRKLTHHNNEREPNYDPIIDLKLISCLLTSDVSIVGLSVLDIMKKILQFQLDNSNIEEITTQCCFTIKDLSFKTYYKGQTFDILYEFLIRLKALKESETKKKTILVKNISEVIKMKNEPCITLELFIELSPYVKPSIFALFNLIDHQHPSNHIFPKLFQTIPYTEDRTLQTIFMEKIFVKYGKLALLGGLNYFLDNTTEPNHIYYDYHSESAKFLELDDYKSQVKYKKEHSLLFSREDLLNYYSDPGSNKYTTKGSEILLSQKNDISTSDLVSDPQALLSEPQLSLDALNMTDAPPIPTTHLNVLKGRTSRNNMSSNKESIYRYVSDDVRSWKTTKTNAPKVSDLKSFVKNTKSKDKEMANSNHKHVKSLRGSQSVKSRVTNITFLLKELQDNTEEESIRDPDEEEITGLDKVNVARSHSIRLHHALNNENRTSMMSMNKNNIYDKIDDAEEFEDAEEDVPELNGRGKLFSTS